MSNKLSSSLHFITYHEAMLRDLKFCLCFGQISSFQPALRKFTDQGVTQAHCTSSAVLNACHCVCNCQLPQKSRFCPATLLLVEFLKH